MDPITAKVLAMDLANLSQAEQDYLHDLRSKAFEEQLREYVRKRKEQSK